MHVIGPRTARAWPARSAGQYARAGPARPVIQAKNEHSEFSACFNNLWQVIAMVFVLAKLI